MIILIMIYFCNNLTSGYCHGNSIGWRFFITGIWADGGDGLWWIFISYYGYLYRLVNILIVRYQFVSFTNNSLWWYYCIIFYGFNIIRIVVTAWLIINYDNISVTTQW